ncbi:unnamed protein product [Caenorhabditis brenneri]
MPKISLVDLCQSKIAELIAENKLQKIEPILPVAWSNTIFDKFLNQEYPTEENIRHISRMLDVKNVCLDTEDMDHNMIRAVYYQVLHGIEIMDLKSYSHFHSVRLLDGDYDDKPPQVKMSQVLHQLISHGWVLKHLVIDGTGVEFVDNWMREIHRKLPNLKSLSLSNFPLTQHHLTTIIDYYPHLTILDITASEIQNLDIISRLPSLEVLSINECKFRDKRDIKELFRCKKIRVLRMAGDLDHDKLRSTTLSLFLKCKRVLPELRILDCSFSNISEKQLQRLLKHQKTLEVVGLIGTDVEHRPDKIDGKPNLELLTIGSFEACLISLDHYLRDKNSRRLLVERILEEIKNFLQKDFKNIPRDQIDTCFDKLCQIYARGATYLTIMVLAVECLEEMCRDQRALDLSFAHRQYLIYILHYEIPNAQPDDPLQLNMKIITKICEIFDNSFLIWNSPENLPVITTAIVGIMNNAGAQLISGPVATVISCLKKCLRHHQVIARQVLPDISNFEVLIRDLLLKEVEEFELCAYTYSELVNIRLEFAYSKVSEMNSEILAYFAKYFEAAHSIGDEQDIMILLESFGSFIGSLPVQVLIGFMEEENFEVYQNLLSSRDCFLRKNVLMILHTVKNVVTLEFVSTDKLEASALHLARELKDWPTEMEKDWDYPEVFCYLQTREENYSETSKSLLKWILEHFVEDEEE